MTRLATRLARLESERASRPSGLPVALVESPFPQNDPQIWALDILANIGGAAGVWVREADAFQVLLPPTNPFDDRPGGEMPSNSEAERLWMGACNSYPHYLICGDGNGEMLIELFTSEDQERERIREMQKEQAG